MMSVGTLSFNINYIQQGQLNNRITVNLNDGQTNSMFMNFFRVKKYGVCHLKINEDISDIVSVRIEVTLN